MNGLIIKSSVVDSELRLMLLLAEGLQDRSITLGDKLDELLSVIEVDIQFLELLQQVPQLLILVGSIFLSQGEFHLQVPTLLLVASGGLLELQGQDPLDPLHFGPVGLRQIP